MPKGSKILMADDDKMLIDMYKERLELAGYQVTICRNGEEALSKVREVHPEIILLDIMMPKLNGYEALASIKSDPTTKDIPVIMLSALMRDFNREKAVEAGADDYLIKSEAMPADVITKIEQVLQRYQKPGTTPQKTVTSSTAQVPMVVTQNDQPAQSSSPATTPIKKTQNQLPPKVEATARDEKIVFTPATPSQPNQSPLTKNIPVVKNEPQPVMQPQISQPPIPVEKKSTNSVTLVIVLAILLTTLINDLVIYYFLFVKK